MGLVRGIKGDRGGDLFNVNAIFDAFMLSSLEFGNFKIEPISRGNVFLLSVIGR
jgi:hypothetical protein